VLAAAPTIVTMPPRRPEADDIPFHTQPRLRSRRPRSTGTGRRVALGVVGLVALVGAAAALASRVISRDESPPRAAERAEVVGPVVGPADSMVAAEGPAHVDSTSRDSLSRDSLSTMSSGGTVAVHADSATGPDSAAARTPNPPASPAPSTVVAKGPPRTRADSLERCRSAVTADQRSCLLARIADTDAELNRTYQELIAELRRLAGSGARSEPRAVRRLREKQRDWLVYRDRECRRRGGGREGPFWADARARCFEELSRLRAADLTAALRQGRDG
jgi:uncharacterized protein YecT (DUF1311 family)